MQTARRGLKWRLRSRAPLFWRRWQEECVIFDPFSGNTHYLNPLAGEIVSALEKGSKCFSEICVIAASFLELKNNAELSTTIEEVMEALEDAGLAQRVPQ